MKYIIVVIITFSISVFAQNVELIYDSTNIVPINSNLPLFIINIKASKCYNVNSFNKILFSVNIKTQDKSIKQTITDSSELSSVDMYNFSDVNFDGYLDIGLVYTGDINNISYNFWLYNKMEKEFVFNSHFSELFNPIFNSQDSTIETFATSHYQTLPVFEKNKYKVIADTLLLIESEYSDIESDEDGKTYLKRIREVLINGEMKIVEEQKDDINSLFYDEK